MSESTRTLPPIASYHQESPHLALCLLRIWQTWDSSPGPLPEPVYLDPPHHTGAILSRPFLEPFVWLHPSVCLWACTCHRCLCVRDPL